MEPTFRPVRTGGPGFSIFVVCFLVAAALTLGLWIYWKRGMTTAAAKPAPAPANTNNNPLARASRTLGAVEAFNKEGESAAESIQHASAPVAATTAHASSAVAPSGGPKLQGIFYSANPSVIINGKSMKVGDESDGLKVLAITKQSVRVQIGAEARELTMK